MSDSKLQVVLVEPISASMEQYVQELAKDESIEFTRIEDPLEAGQVVLQLAPCIVLASFADTDTYMGISMLLDEIAKVAKAGGIKMILTSPLNDRRIANEIRSHQYAALINEPVKLKTLSFKFSLFRKAIEAIAGISSEVKPSSESLKFSNEKEKQNTAWNQKLVFRKTPSVAAETDVFVAEGGDPKKVGKNFLLSLEIAGGAEVKWQSHGLDEESGTACWRMLGPEEEEIPDLLNKPRNGWLFFGEEPNFDQETGRWQFQSAAPELSLWKDGRKSSEKIAFQNKEMTVAEDSERAKVSVRLKKLETEQKAVQRKKEAKDVQIGGKPQKQSAEYIEEKSKFQNKLNESSESAAESIKDRRSEGASTESEQKLSDKRGLQDKDPEALKKSNQEAVADDPATNRESAAKDGTEDTLEKKDNSQKAAGEEKTETAPWKKHESVSEEQKEIRKLKSVTDGTKDETKSSKKDEFGKSSAAASKKESAAKTEDSESEAGKSTQKLYKVKTPKFTNHLENQKATTEPDKNRLKTMNIISTAEELTQRRDLRNQPNAIEKANKPKEEVSDSIVGDPKRKKNEANELDRDKKRARRTGEANLELDKTRTAKLNAVSDEDSLFDGEENNREFSENERKKSTRNTETTGTKNSNLDDFRSDDDLSNKRKRGVGNEFDENNTPGSGAGLASVDLASGTPAPRYDVDSYYKNFNEIPGTGAWMRTDRHYLFLEAEVSYRGYNQIEDIYPIWIFAGEDAPERQEQNKRWRFIRENAKSIESVKNTPPDVLEYLRDLQKRAKQTTQEKPDQYENDELEKESVRAESVPENMKPADVERELSDSESIDRSFVRKTGTKESKLEANVESDEANVDSGSEFTSCASDDFNSSKRNKDEKEKNTESSRQHSTENIDNELTTSRSRSEESPLDAKDLEQDQIMADSSHTYENFVSEESEPNKGRLHELNSEDLWKTESKISKLIRDDLSGHNQSEKEESRTSDLSMISGDIHESDAAINDANEISEANKNTNLDVVIEANPKNFFQVLNQSKMGLAVTSILRKLKTKNVSVDNLITFEMRLLKEDSLLGKWTFDYYCSRVVALIRAQLIKVEFSILSIRTEEVRKFNSNELSSQLVDGDSYSIEDVQKIAIGPKSLFKAISRKPSSHISFASAEWEELTKSEKSVLQIVAREFNEVFDRNEYEQAGSVQQIDRSIYDGYFSVPFELVSKVDQIPFATFVHLPLNKKLLFALGKDDRYSESKRALFQRKGVQSVWVSAADEAVCKDFLEKMKLTDSDSTDLFKTPILDLESSRSFLDGLSDPKLIKLVEASVVEMLAKDVLSSFTLQIYMRPFVVLTEYYLSKSTIEVGQIETLLTVHKRKQFFDFTVLVGIFLLIRANFLGVGSRQRLGNLLVASLLSTYGLFRWSEKDNKESHIESCRSLLLSENRLIEIRSLEADLGVLPKEVHEFLDSFSRASAVPRAVDVDSPPQLTQFSTLYLHSVFMIEYLYSNQVRQNLFEEACKFADREIEKHDTYRDINQKLVNRIEELLWRKRKELKKVS